MSRESESGVRSRECGAQSIYDRMAERFFDTGHSLLMVTSDGRLYEGTLPGLTWRHILPSVPGIHAIAILS